MRRILFLLLTSLGALSLYGQDLSCSPASREAFQEKIKSIQSLEEQPFGKQLVAIGKSFLGTPYVAGTLERKGHEPLVVELTGLDCTTFMEQVLVFGRMKTTQRYAFDHYLQLLEELRYRGGIREGYASRLHYFSEWIRDNERKGWVQDIAADLGGRLQEKRLDFMSTHRESYPALAEEEAFTTLQELEETLSGSPLCFLPKAEIAKLEPQLQDGDIIALLTRIPGLDVTHTGMLSREANGSIHLLHASTGSMQVEISEQPLFEYLQEIDHVIGILIARPMAAE